MLKSFSQLFAIMAFAIFASDSYANPKLFNKIEAKTIGISEFPKWVDALKKHTDETAVYQKKCSENKKMFYCNIDEWSKFISTLDKKNKKEQLKAVNDYANKHKYVIDQDNWGVEDYWESPGEFLFKNGDCEDYAIIKYLSLKELGYSIDDMRILMLYDNNLATFHSVLVVYSDDDTFILDNQINSVISSKRIYHYNPIYSINENSWWKYL